jgi:hypothetical protein
MFVVFVFILFIPRQFGQRTAALRSVQVLIILPILFVYRVRQAAGGG